MGNYISCSIVMTPLMKNSKAARVVFPTGEVRQFHEPMVRAAELMLECPNFFLNNSKSLHIGRRFSPLSADEELESGNIYLMFPMKRVNSVVVAADMVALFMVANSATRRISGGDNSVRVQPEGDHNHGGGGGIHPEVVEGSRLSLDEIEDEGLVQEFRFRLVASRSRKPSLETITEESIRTR